MKELLAQIQPLADKFGIAGYISTSGILLIEAAGFIAVFLLIGTLFDLIFGRDITKVKKWWKILGKVFLAGTGLIGIGLIISLIKGSFA